MRRATQGLSGAKPWLTNTSQCSWFKREWGCANPLCTAHGQQGCMSLSHCYSLNIKAASARGDRQHTKPPARQPCTHMHLKFCKE